MAFPPATADEAAEAALVAALLAASAADEAALVTLEAASSVASLVWEQLTAKVATRARPTVAAVARMILIDIEIG